MQKRLAFEAVGMGLPLYSALIRTGLGYSGERLDAELQRRLSQEELAGANANGAKHTNGQSEPTKPLQTVREIVQEEVH